jgi:PAS domain S-box-containing protein
MVMRVLLIEDDPADARIIREILKDSPAGDVQLQHETRLGRALERLDREPFDVVVLDLGLPDSRGIGTLTRTQDAKPDLPIVILTGLDDEGFALEAVRAGAQDYLVKGRFDSELLVRTIRYAVERKRTAEEVRRLNAELERRVAERTAQLQASNDELLREVAERKRAEEALRASHERLKKVLEVETVGVMFWDLNTGCLTDANDTFLKMMGYSRSDVEAHDLTWQKFTPPEYHALSLAEIRKFQATGRVGPYEKEYFRKDGTRRWLLLAGSSLGNNQCVEFCVDIADRKQTEEALRRTGQDLDRAEAVGQIGWWRLDTRQNVLTWSPENHRIFGVPEGTPMSYDSFLSIVHPDDRQYVDTHWQAGLRGEPYDVEHRIMADGRVKWVREKAYLEFDTDGKLLGGFGITQDITARKQAEEALRESRAKLEAALASMTDAVFISDAEGRFIDFNDAFATFHRFKNKAECARTFAEYPDILDVFMADGTPAPVEMWAVPRALRGETVTNAEYRLRRKDTGETWVGSYSFAPIRDRDGKIVGSVVAGRDITDRKQAEEELKAAKLSAERAKAVAEAASRAKDQFIAVLSHELRTPLTPAVAAMSLLRTDVRLPADVHEDLEMVSRNLDLEVRLIADLLDVSRIISGKLHLEKRLADVAAAMREAAKIVSGDLDAKGQTLTVETPGAPYLTLADAARLQQVFWNLLRNSIKFSPARSRITMRAKLVSTDHCPLASNRCIVGMGECPIALAAGSSQPRGENLVVEVTDEGSGIDPEMLPRLFNAFEQGRRARSFGGLGLGLSICKAVVEMHGGTISASSEGVGCGATFTVRLPVAQCPLQPASAPQRQATTSERSVAGQPENRPLKILIVEDHADTAKVMRRLLKAEGHYVTVAGTVSEGLACVRQATPDVLISDLGLPDGSGLDLMRELLEQGQHIASIALSGYGTPADVEKSRAAGFAEHLVKPLSSVGPLIAAIARLGVSARN